MNSKLLEPAAVSGFSRECGLQLFGRRNGEKVSGLGGQ